MEQESTIVKLMERVEKLEQADLAARRTAFAWEDVAAKARQYAIVKTQGVYLERGSIIHINFSERENMTKHFADEVLRAAESALAQEIFSGD